MQTNEKLKLIEDEIRKVSKSMKRFRDGPLTQSCVVVLLHHQTKIPMGTIRAVLNGAADLEDHFLK